jgi:hypothetical protein
MTKKNKRIFPIKIFCKKCNTLLYNYDKEGAGSLIKCFVDRIKKNKTKGDLKCPKCFQEFARLSKIKGRPIHKIIRGKVFTKGHCPK